MEQKYIMGNTDVLNRNNETPTFTIVSDGLRMRMMALAIREAMGFYGVFFDKEVPRHGWNDLAGEYDDVFSEALGLGLVGEGGIREKDHLALWCLGKVLAPKFYVESGVFAGSSLHALIHSHRINSIVAIDPDLSKIAIRSKDLGAVQLIDRQDFSEIEFGEFHSANLVYFDDHINTADRIIQASNKGFKYLLFDDSTGIEGLCQRLYPAVPTVPMIMNYECFQAGDSISWSFVKSESMVLKRKSFFRHRLVEEVNSSRVNLVVTDELLSTCAEAKKCICKCRKIPNLGDYIAQRKPGPGLDVSKFLIELH